MLTGEPSPPSPHLGSKLEWKVKITGSGTMPGICSARLRGWPGGNWTLMNSSRALRLSSPHCDNCLKSETRALHNWFFSSYKTSCSCTNFSPMKLVCLLAGNGRDWKRRQSRKRWPHILVVLTPLWQVTSYSCNSTSIIKPCFRVLTTALGGGETGNDSLGWNVSYSFSPPGWKSYSKVWQKVCDCVKPLKWPVEERVGGEVRDCIGVRSEILRVLVCMMFGSWDSLITQWTPSWFLQITYFPDSWVLKEIRKF